MGGGLESRCVGRVCGADGAVRAQFQSGFSNCARDGHLQV